MRLVARIETAGPFVLAKSVPYAQLKRMQNVVAEALRHAPRPAASNMAATQTTERRLGTANFKAPKTTKKGAKS